MGEYDEYDGDTPAYTQMPDFETVTFRQSAQIGLQTLILPNDVSCITFAYTVIHSRLYQIRSIEQINQLHDLLHEVYKNECPSTDTLNYIFYNQYCLT